MNKFASFGLKVAGQVLLGQVIVFTTMVTVGLAGKTVEKIQEKKETKKSLTEERNQVIRDTYEMLKTGRV